MKRIEDIVYVASDGTKFFIEDECVEYEARACPIVETHIGLHSNEDAQYHNGKKLGLTEKALQSYTSVAYDVCLTVSVNRLTGETICTAVNDQPLVTPIEL